MPPILTLALKDLRMLVRLRSALFFTVVWPLLVAIFFGLMFGGPPRGGARLPLVIVDEDGTSGSRAFVDGLAKRDGIEALVTTRDEAQRLVRRGQRVGAVILPTGFGEASQRLFHGTPPQVELLIDPSRIAEAAMLEGLLFEQAARRMQDVLGKPAATRAFVADTLEKLESSPDGQARKIGPPLKRFMTELDAFMAAQDRVSGGDSDAAVQAAWQPVTVTRTSVAREQRGPENGFAVTIPQGMIWGILGAMMTFAVGIAVERTQGTLVRLRMSPLPGWVLLLGKALACYLAIVFVELLIVATGVLFFGVRPGSPGLLLLAVLVAPVAFVGIMMLVASLAKTEQAAGGAGWAAMMPLAMVGGAMIPLIVMPAWLLTISHVSPVKWAILAFEGAIWRGFSWQEMMLPFAILLATGAVTFLLGARAFRTVV